MTDITLNDGTTLPRIGFGTYQLKGFDGTDAIRSALDIGYRLIDTAVNYENEGTVGRAVRVSGIDREELRISSKLPGRFHGHHDAILCVEESLARAGLDYFDFFLIHWPNPKRGKYVEAFEALAECRNRGLIRSLGVSNFCPSTSKRCRMRSANTRASIRLRCIRTFRKTSRWPGIAPTESRQRHGVRSAERAI